MHKRVFSAFFPLGLLATLTVPLMACRETGNSRSPDSPKVEDTYFNDAEIRTLITNNLVTDGEGLEYGGGIVFYPNNRGIRFSEGTIQLFYAVKDGWVCVAERGMPNACFRFKEQDGNVVRVQMRNGRLVQDKITVRKFIR